MRSSIRTLAVLLAAFMAGVSTLTLLAGPAAAEPRSEEADFVARINTLRASHGLPTLSVDQHLTDVARTWSAQMAAAGAISHNPNLATDFANWRTLGENVGVGATVDWLESAFEASPHHYANLVDPEYTWIGVGIVESGGQIWVTEDFEQPRSGAAAYIAPPKPRPAPAPRPAAAPRPAVVAAPKPAVAAAPKPAVAAPPVTAAPATTSTSTSAPAPQSVVLATRATTPAEVSHPASSTRPGTVAGMIALVLLAGVAVGITRKAGALI